MIAPCMSFYIKAELSDCQRIEPGGEPSVKPIFWPKQGHRLSGFRGEGEAPASLNPPEIRRVQWAGEAD